MDKKYILFIFPAFLLLALIVTADDPWIIDGNKVYVDDAKVYISAEPHTLTGSGWVYFDILSKVYTGEVDVVFGFDTDSLQPLTAQKWNGERWINVSNSFSSINYNHGGMTKWWYIKNFPIVEDQNYKVRIWIKHKNYVLDSAHKYWFAIKPSSETISEAISNGHLYALDPWTSDLNDNIVNYWKFNEGTGTNISDSLGLSHALAVGSPDWVTGKLNWSVNFDGTNYANYTQTTTKSNWSIVGWFKSNITPANDIIWSSKTSTYYYLELVNNSHIDFYAGASKKINTGGTIGTDWHLIGLTLWSNGTGEAYFDGSKINDTIYSGATNLENKEFIFGKFGGTTSNNFTGSLDEWAIYNKTLNSTQIAAFWNSGTGISYASDTNVTLISPNDGVSVINTTQEFICLPSTFNTLANVSLIIDGSINDTNSSGLKINTSFTKDLSFGVHTWNCEVCDDVRCINGTQRTITVGHFKTTSQSYNTTTFETATENFMINFTSYNTTPITGILIWNGSSQGTGTLTQNGTNFSLTKEIGSIPLGTGSKHFHWNITTGGTISSSTSTTQVVGLTSFGLCNGSLTVPYYNISFVNETVAEEDVTATLSSTWTYYLGDGTVTKTLTYTNNTENLNYGFCLSPPNRTMITNFSLTYDNSISEERSFSDTLSLTNTTTEKTLKLLPSADGIYVTFQVINQADQVISGVSANVSISGTLIDSGLTDDAGTITFFLDPDTSYTFAFNKTNYGTYTTTLTPSQTSYTITLGETISLEEDYTRGIAYSIEPKLTYLINDTSYEFNLTLGSSYWTVTSFGFLLKNGSTVLNSTTASSNGGFVSSLLNTGNYTEITLNAFWIIGGNITNVSKTYYVWDETGTGFGLKTFFERISTYLADGMFGLDNFGLMIIIFMIIFITTGIFSYKYGLTSPMAIASILFFMVAFFDIALDIIPGRQGLATFLVGLIFVGVLVQEVKK